MLLSHKISTTSYTFVRRCFLVVYLLFGINAALAQNDWQSKLDLCKNSNYYDWIGCRLQYYMQQYPQSQLRDVYKYCFQDYFGLEHLMSDSASAARYIESEIRTADSADWRQPRFYYPLLLNNYVRVDIGYVHNGIIPIGTMVSAMLQSASTLIERDIELWHQRWQSIIQLLKQINPQPLNYDEDYRLIEQLLDSGKYAFHHSRQFNQTYHQHYRIIRRDVFESMLLPLILASEL